MTYDCATNDDVSAKWNGFLLGVTLVEAFQVLPLLVFLGTAKAKD